MKAIFILFGYLRWHYSKAIFSLSSIWIDFLKFSCDFFSIKLLIKNFFDPWKKMTDNYPKWYDIKKYLEAFITNIIVRIVGVIMRICLLLIWLLCYIILLFLYPFILLVWLILPIIVIVLISYGLFFIIK